MSKKGDLALSTNAIVVLIIAVIMLGLIITFVTGAFDTISETFLGKIKTVEDPVGATSSKPITSSGDVIVKEGKKFNVKVSVYNKDIAPVSDVKPSITCDPSDTSFRTLTLGNDIPAKGSVVFTLIGTAGTPDTYLCQIDGTLGSKADFTVTVNE